MNENFEQSIRLPDAARMIPGRDGHCIHVNTIKRWISIGCRGVKLRAWRIGQCWYTSLAALEDFRRACTPGQSMPEFRSTAQASKEKAAAERRMAERGFVRARCERGSPAG